MKGTTSTTADPTFRGPRQEHHLEATVTVHFTADHVVMDSHVLQAKLAVVQSF